MLERAFHRSRNLR